MSTGSGNDPRPLRVAVVGTGSLGRHHVRLVAASPRAELVGVVDLRPEVALAVAREHGTRVLPDLDAVAAEAEAAVVAVPTVDHAAVGVRLLSDGLHVLVEKPIAASLEEADRLLEAAASAGRRLAVGHVEFYNPAVQALLQRKEETPARFVEVERLSRFTARSLDVDVVLDLMIHDLQILHALDPSPVAEVRATGIEVLTPRIDLANVRIALESGCVANLTASRVSAEPVRKLRVFSRDRYASLDYREQEVKGFRLARDTAGAAGGAQESAPGAGAMPRIVPADLPVAKGEPLARELEGFLAAVRGEAVPWVDGAEGRRALATALDVLQAI